MSQRVPPSTAALLLLSLLPASAIASAQEPAPPPAPSQAEAASAPAAPAPLPPLVPAPGSVEKLVVPIGTRLPLILRNGINTRTAKAGDSVYFETIYPIAQNNRIVIPIGSFVRGEILEARRPGRIKGRGEFRILLNQITFPNGYSLPLAATPNSLDRDGREGVDPEGRIKGPSGAGKDAGLVLQTTTGGAFIGTLAGAAANGAPGAGALIGGGIGAAAGILAVLLTRGPEAELPRGTMMDVVTDRPLVLEAEHLPARNDPGKLSQPLPPQSASAEERRDRYPRSPLPLRGLFPFSPF